MNGPSTTAPRLLSVVKVLKIHNYKDLSIAYDRGVDIVRLGVVDFPTTGIRGIVIVAVVRTLYVVIGLKATIRLEGIHDYCRVVSGLYH